MSRALALTLALLLLPAGAAASGPETLLPPPGEMAPLTAAGPAEAYDPDTLWEKIDGEAELYRRFRLVGAAYRLYRLPDDEDATLEVGIYRHDSPLEAFGVYAASRPLAGTPLPYGSEAVAEGFQAFMRHGPHFVTVTSFLEEELHARLVAEALRLTAEAMGPVPPELPLLRSLREIPGAEEIGYRPDHLLGRKIFPPGVEFSLGGTLFFVATSSTVGQEVLDGAAALLASSQTAREGETVILRGEGGALRGLTLALREGRLAGARAPALTAAERETLLHLLRVELP